MFVACSTLCFARHPLERALQIIGELEFNKADLAIHEQGPHLRPSEVVDDVGRAAQRIRMGLGVTPAAFSVEIEAADEEEFEQQLRAVCRLARIASVAVMSLPAGAADGDFEEEVRWLTHLTRLAEVEGIVLTVETRMGTVTETPDSAVELCQRIPGLGLTLDPSHFIAGPHQGKSYDQVFPHVRHVHLRDSGRGPGQFQVRVGQGEIEYGRIITQLARFHYDRVLTVQIQDTPDVPFVMEQEVRKLKYLLESLV